MNENNSIVVFLGTEWQAQMVKGLLEASDITAFIKDEIIGTLLPYSGGGSISVKVVIQHKDIEKAKPIVEEYMKNMQES